MKMKYFTNLVTLQVLAMDEIELFFLDKLKLVEYTDDVDVSSPIAHPEFQSDCDGDNDHITCQVELKLKTKATQDLFKQFLIDYYWQCFNIKIKNVGDPLCGDHYTFTYKYYI